MFTTWNEMTEVQRLQCTYSDFFKEVYGFRPRSSSDEQWNSESWLNEQLDALMIEAERKAERDAERERQAIEAFEKTVAATILAGAPDRATAIRWIKASVDTIDNDYFEYTHGLPYGYLKG